MGLFTKDIKTMDDLLLHGLQDIYYAEQQITKALPKMIDKATNRDLTHGLKNHLEETNKQIERLDQVFKKLGKQPSGTKCPAIDGIIKEADEAAGEVDDKEVLDAAIVAAAQAVEHYEIAPLRHADRLGRSARPRRHRPLPHHQPQRGEGGQHQAEHRRAAKGRQHEGIGRCLIGQGERWRPSPSVRQKPTGRSPLRSRPGRRRNSSKPPSS